MNLEVLVVCASLAGVVFYSMRLHEVGRVGTGIAGIADNCLLFKHHSLKRLAQFELQILVRVLIILSVFGVIYYGISHAIPLRYL